MIWALVLIAVVLAGFVAGLILLSGADKGDGYHEPPL